MLTVTMMVVAALNVTSVQPMTPGCLPVDRTMDGLVMRVRASIASSTTGEWHGINILNLDTLTVRPVQNDSLCRLALETLNNYLSSELPRVNHLRLLYVNDQFFAEQAPDGPTHSEFWPQFVFDGTLRKVLFPCRNGHAQC
jgi:hypothetical protein